MFTRRAFMQSAAVTVGAAAPLLGGVSAFAYDATQSRILIDSIEAPYFNASQEANVLRLSGTQMERLADLRAIFAQGKTLEVQASLDGSGRVLLDAALLVTATSVRDSRQQDNLLTFTSQPV